MAGTDDLRDLWNQQTPFAIAEEFQPVFRQRLINSLTNWDMRDGHADWTPATLAASANVYLDDFILFDVSKPISDTSFLEIEKSTLHGQVYQTGGGRTVNANVIDIMVTWMVNNDREFLQGGEPVLQSRASIHSPIWPLPTRSCRLLLRASICRRSRIRSGLSSARLTEPGIH
jgi:hypothetical protein